MRDTTKQCPEGHEHTSGCRRNGCPCDTDHRHTTLSEFSRMGGNATLAKYGKKHFSKIAKGWPKGKKRKPDLTTNQEEGTE